MRVSNGIDIKNERARLGLSQSDVATALGVDLSTVRNWEHGRTNLNAKKLTEINEKLLALVSRERKATTPGNLTPSMTAKIPVEVAAASYRGYTKRERELLKSLQELVDENDQ